MHAAIPLSIQWVYMLSGEILNTLITAGITGVVAFAASWGGVKRSVNGMREDVSEIKSDVKELGKEQTRVRERLAFMEGRR